MRELEERRRYLDNKDQIDAETAKMKLEEMEEEVERRERGQCAASDTATS